MCITKEFSGKTKNKKTESWRVRTVGKALRKDIMSDEHMTSGDS